MSTEQITYLDPIILAEDGKTTYEYHVCERNDDKFWDIPIRIAVVDTYDEALAYVEQHQPEHKGHLYVAQRRVW